MSRVLVVEDEPAIAELIALNLRHSGFEVTLAGDAERVRPCIACNQGCVGGIRTPLQRMMCTVNPAVGFERTLGENLIRPVETPQKVVVVGGDFGDANWDAFGEDKRVYGDKGVIIETVKGGPEYVGIWNDELMIVGSSQKEIEAALDRIEDRAPSHTPRIADFEQYGDVYGVVSAEDLAMMLPESERELAEKLKGAVENVELHVDASEDVAITAEVSGPVEADVSDLSKSLGAAFALARLQAQSKREKDLAELLDYASISPREGRFSIDLALPLDVLIQKMGPCRRGDGGAGGR